MTNLVIIIIAIILAISLDSILYTTVIPSSQMTHLFIIVVAIILAIILDSNYLSHGTQVPK
jgi:hypothetical protein